MEGKMSVVLISQKPSAGRYPLVMLRGVNPDLRTVAQAMTAERRLRFQSAEHPEIEFNQPSVFGGMAQRIEQYIYLDDGSCTMLWFTVDMKEPVYWRYYDQRILVREIRIEYRNNEALRWMPVDQLYHV